MIITSFSRAGYDQYGKVFVDTFLEHWPDENLAVYHEGLPSDVVQDPRVTYVDMTRHNTFLTYARALHEADPLYKGVMRHGEQQIYNFRFDVFKFFRKVWALKHYDETRTSDELICWLDADIEFHKDLPAGFLKGLLKDAYLAYIGRGGGLHSECGAMIFNPLHPAHADFFEVYWRIFQSGAFRRLDEWHDSFVFDFVRDLIQPPEVNLGRGCDPLHPFVFTKFGLYMDHKKGPERKVLGYSPEAQQERDVRVSNRGERLARPTLAQMKPNHVKRYQWAAAAIKDMELDISTINDADKRVWRPDVLDAACGVGYGAQVLSGAAGAVYAVDLSEEALAYAQEHYAADNVFYLPADLEEPEALPAADVAVSLETIEHVTDSGRLVRAFADKCPVLIGSVPNQDVVPFSEDTHPFHYRHFTRVQLEQMLNGAGYRVTRWATQYDKVPGEVYDGKTDGMCLLFVAERVAA